MAAEVTFEKATPSTTGLRDRKKVRTRHAIEDAALGLFAEQGYEATTVEDIAACADVSITTFFRYFPNKSDVVLSDQIERLPSLGKAIIERPSGEPELEVLRKALQVAWVDAIDPVRTARTVQAIASSRMLGGLGHEVGYTWQVAVSEALAERRRLRKVDDRCWLAATMALATFGDAVKAWVASDCRGSLGRSLDTKFDALQGLCDGWAAGG